MESQKPRRPPGWSAKVAAIQEEMARRRPEAPAPAETVIETPQERGRRRAGALASLRGREALDAIELLRLFATAIDPEAPEVVDRARRATQLRRAARAREIADALDARLDTLFGG